jgi:hypothetical protein
MIENFHPKVPHQCLESHPTFLFDLASAQNNHGTTECLILGSTEVFHCSNLSSNLGFSKQSSIRTHLCHYHSCQPSPLWSNSAKPWPFHFPASSKNAKTLGCSYVWEVILFHQVSFPIEHVLSTCGLNCTKSNQIWMGYRKETKSCQCFSSGVSFHHKQFPKVLFDFSHALWTDLSSTWCLFCASTKEHTRVGLACSDPQLALDFSNLSY